MAKAEPRDPDFVWIGCGTCWQPQDSARPVRSFSDYEADGMRFRPFVCATCSAKQAATIEVHPTVWGMSVEDWQVVRAGDVAAQSTEVQRWGG